MAACTECNLCDRPGSLSSAIEAGRVPCNVRRHQDDLFSLWRCTGCGSIHCAEDADLPRYYADYPLKKQRLTFSERIGYKNRLRLLENQGFHRSGRILDYGCGAGLFVQFLKDQGLPQVFGYDAFVPAFRDPKRLEETFDAVVSYDVIEHDENPKDFLRRLAGLLRPGGLLVIGTPRAEGVSIARIKNPQLHPPYHRHILSERALLALAHEQGLMLENISRRSFYDSLVPTVNARFMWRYIEQTGGFLDAAVEPPKPSVVWRSPEMILLAVFGFFFPLGDNMLAGFRKA